MKKSKGVVIIALILACLVGLGDYTTTIVTTTSTSQAKTDNKEKSEGIKLGLDLSGGVSITYRGQKPVKGRYQRHCGKAGRACRKL